MKKAFITGVNGQDGSYLAELLLSKGYDVHGLIRRSSSFNTQRVEQIYHDPHESGVRFRMHYGDLSDSGSLVNLIRDLEPDEIYHLGAQSHVKVSFEIPEYTSDATGMGTVKATPLSACGSWRGSMRVAHLLSASARSGSGGLEDSEFWHAAAEKLLSPLLFAAASSAGEMADVVRWLDDGPAAEPEVRELLEASECAEALSAWRANWNREERQRSSIYTTAETIVRAFADPRVLEASSRADYTPAALLDGGANTLYLCAPAHEQERLRSLFAAMLSELVGVVQEFSAQTGKPIDPPLLMVLDEAANTAPMPELDVVASTGAGQGIQLVTVFQDFAQVEARWGKRASTILNNHQAKVFSTGISDPETLRYVSAVVGDGEFRQRSETAAERGRGSSTEGSTYRALTPANVVREAKPGTGLLIYGHRPPARIALRPWFKDRELSRMVEGRTR